MARAKTVHPIRERATPVLPPRKKLSPHLRLLSYGLVAFGVVSLGYPYLRPTPSVGQVSLTEAPEPIRPDQSMGKATVPGALPVRIIIPDHHIDLPVYVAHLTNGYWETTLKGASFGEGSAPPGTQGNTVIFGHAREGLFLPLKDTKVGELVYIFTSSRWFSYRVTELKEVKPRDVYLVKPTSTAQLTLFTCSGFLDSKRFVVIAKPTE